MRGTTLLTCVRSDVCFVVRLGVEQTATILALFVAERLTELLEHLHTHAAEAKSLKYVVHTRRRVTSRVIRLWHRVGVGRVTVIRDGSSDPVSGGISTIRYEYSLTRVVVVSYVRSFV